MQMFFGDEMDARVFTKVLSSVGRYQMAWQPRPRRFYAARYNTDRPANNII